MWGALKEAGSSFTELDIRAGRNALLKESICISPELRESGMIAPLKTKDGD